VKLIFDIDGDFNLNIATSQNIILTSNFLLVGKLEYVFYIDKSLLDDSPILSNELNRLFASFPESFLSFRNGVYMRIFRPVFSAIRQIELLTEEFDIDEIVLMGGSNFPFFTMYGGEGEGHHWWYKPSWLYNFFVYQYFYKSIHTNWIQKNNYYVLKCFHYLRESLIHLKLYKRIILNHFRSKRNHCDNRKAYKYLVYTMLPLQTNHITRILRFLDFEKLLFIKPYSSDTQYSLNEVHYKLLFSDYRVALNSWKNEYQRILVKEEILFLTNKVLSFSNIFFLIALKFSFIEYYMNLRCINRAISSFVLDTRPVYITNMTFGDDIVLINNLAKLNGVCHYNFQAVAMSIMWYPQIKLADMFYMYSEKSCDFYKKLDSSYSFYLPVESVEDALILKNGDLLTITIFLQPDNYTPRYLSFLVELNRLLISKEIKNVFFKIKPHYRQNNLASFEYIVSGSPFFELVNSSIRSSELMKVSDFVLSMTSSILFEAVQLNCPAIVLDLSGFDRSFVEINCLPEVNFVVNDFDSLFDILINPIKFKNLFVKRRNEYLTRTKGFSFKGDLLKL
jgi:hypothetical protein